MTLAMAAFTLEDMLLKSVGRVMPVGQMMVLFGLGGMVIFIALTRARGEAAFPRALLSRPLLIRSGCEVVGRLCFTLAIVLTPLSSASAILQATPLVIVVGAVVVFGERVGWRQWAAVMAGFAGVLMIIRPGLDAFEPLSLFAVVGMLGFAMRDLATRAAPASMSSMQLGVAGFLTLVVAGAMAGAVEGRVTLPAPVVWGQLGIAIVIGVAAYHTLTRAVRTGTLSVVAPFRYTRILFAFGVGVAIFGERPDAATLAGGALIVASGLYTIMRRA